MRAEAAQEQLEAFRVENWLDRRLDSAARLPAKLREIAYSILGCDAKGNVLATFTKARLDAEDQGLEQLDGLSLRDRGRVFDALFPQLGNYVEQAWQLHRRLPYQIGWKRLAFRAPHTPETVRKARQDWLSRLLQAVEGYEQDIRWFAAWAPHLGLAAPHRLGVLFAAAIDADGRDGDAVFDILVASARGDHEIGSMGRHVTRGLLIASRPDGWAFIEQLLLAAQRQEGLRGVILETVDEAHPEAFRRMLRVILDNNLTRFSSTVRAVNVWFGAQWETRDARTVNDALAGLLSFLDDSGTRGSAFTSDDAQALYLALWSMAFEDAITTVEPASQLLVDANVERRFAAAHLLSQLGLIRSLEALLDALGDEDLRVVTRALMAFGRIRDERIFESDLFERIERLIPRLPVKKQELEPIVWPWMKLPAEQKMGTSALIWSLGKRSPTRLIPYLPLMSPQDRAKVVGRLDEMSRQDADVRDTLLVMVGDRSNWVRAAALKALAKHTVTAQDAEALEALLARKTADLRRGVISLLLTQSDGDVLASVERLLDSSNAPQRLAGLELLRQMTETERSTDRCRHTAAKFQERRGDSSHDEDELLSRILDRPVEAATLEDALGLLEPTERTLPMQPQRGRRVSSLFRRHSLVTPAAIACIGSLDALVHQQRAMPVKLQTWQGEQDELLGNAGLHFPMPKPELPAEENIARLPAYDLWRTWAKDRLQTLRDDDGLELPRASAALYRPLYAGYEPPSWLRKALNTLFTNADLPQLRYPVIVLRVLIWLYYLSPPTGVVDLMLNGIETTFGLVPQKELKRVPDSPFDRGWRSSGPLLGWLDLARYYRSLCPELWDGAQHVRLWRLLRWMDEPGPPVPRHRPQLEETLAAYEAGGATRSDLLDHLLGPRGQAGYSLISFPELRQLTGRKPSPLIKKHPVLGDLVDACRDRILEIELGRGEMPTAAAGPATALRYAGGLDLLISVLKAMGNERLIRGWTYDSLSRANVFSHLLRATMPLDSDRPEVFSAQTKAAKIPQKRMVELAVYAPQWAVFVECALGWPGLADAVWWLHGHTKDTRWQVDQEIRELWTAQISEHTPLSGQQLLDGAVDVAWFMRAYRALGSERWERVYKAAKLASGGGGHKRAQLFADAMLGHIEKADLMSRINEKRHQDTVRSLGLLPLAEGGQRESDLLNRYRVFQEFLRTSRKFGSQRQASERLAIKVGMENLARTAGFPDPVRLEWAMEAQEVADLASGSKTVRVGEVTLTLAINRWGEIELTIKKNAKSLRAVPAKLRKEPAVVELRNRRTALKRQVSRMRRSLEAAMGRGDQYTAAELWDLLTHPLLAPMLEHLVFLGEGVIGYPVDDGAALQNHDGTRYRLEDDTKLRIAHPFDLYRTLEWHLWQRECYLAEHIQPFKQVFRELYLLTEAEKAEGTVSRRYAGHQVKPRQALALLGQRGWVNIPEEGVRRTFHDAGISAWLTFVDGFLTPAEVEGLTLDGVQFTRRGEWEPLPLTEIPPRLFSQVMRDLDLVVSVAHEGGVDPEASASTVEMRASLVRETCAMLGITNVELSERHVLIGGTLSDYTVHLGSAVVHQQPGGAVCIVPVHAQHRGHLFLPFADDDPKTAEVISKVLLLARDKEIKDPTILEQILVKPR